MNYALLGFIVYLVIIQVVGFITYNRNKSHKDFFIAGRQLNPRVVAFSERASGESDWLLFGLPGATFALGLLEFWTALGSSLGPVILIMFVWSELTELDAMISVRFVSWVLTFLAVWLVIRATRHRS